ncbi:hypothetical protein OCU04_008394 [Sclerotinia nivalis]|uniref:Fungal N-terminal domain-containing protein n=1 Tax=Sclerotinia nivalis TaxID=352851 RepID=A0A9X0DJL7_9HELO|nr:hypothetical protein OCU04_008394 [Sclerotinia nivalis]
MMNPLDALSLAGTIIQFVDFSSKVIAGANELYKFGAESLNVHQQLGLAVDDLSKLSKRLSDSYSDLCGNGVKPAPADNSFICICKNATELSTELNNKLSSLKVTATGKRRKWQTLKQALKSVWSEKELMDLKNRLALLRDSIQMHIVVDLRDQLSLISSSQTSRFDNLDFYTQTIVTALLKYHDEVSKSVQDQTTAITQLLGRMELLADKHMFFLNVVPQLNMIEDSQNQALMATGKHISQEQMLHNLRWQEKVIHLQVAQCLIQSLKFPTLKEREETIADVYRGTFNGCLMIPMALCRGLVLCNSSTGGR